MSFPWQLPLALRRLLSPLGSRPMHVAVRAVLPAPARAARRVLLDWEAPWLDADRAGLVVRGVDYGDTPAAAPLRPGAMREVVRASKRLCFRGAINLLWSADQQASCALL